MTEPCDLGAVQARRLMAQKRLSPVFMSYAVMPPISRANVESPPNDN